MIVIHPGLKKAGSAAIQTFLSANAPALQDLGVFYPTVGRATRKAHHHLASEVRGRSKYDPAFGSLADLARYWAGARPGVMVISSEMFEECDQHETAAIRNTLMEADDDIRIVLYVRNMTSLMPSSYIQKIKFGNNNYDFDTFFERRMKERRIHFFETAQRWARTFGWKNMRVRMLDPAFLVKGDLIDDFMARLGLDLNSGRLKALVRPGEVNVAPGWRIAEAIRALYGEAHGLPPGHPLADAGAHRDGQKRKIARKAVAVGEALGWSGDRGRYLTWDQARRCREVSADNVAALNARLRRPLPPPPALDPETFPARAFMPDAAHIDPGELRAFYDALGDYYLETVHRPNAVDRPAKAAGKPAKRASPTRRRAPRLRDPEPADTSGHAPMEGVSA